MAANPQAQNAPSPYPDQIPLLYSVTSTIDRKTLEKWDNIPIVSRRTGRALPLEPVEQKTRILQIKASGQPIKEQFHNYDVIDGQDSWGRCLCEIQLWTGSACAIKHLRRDVSLEEQDRHWAWYVDIAPHGQVCPLAKERQKSKSDARNLACEIWFKDMPPDANFALHRPSNLHPYFVPPELTHVSYIMDGDPAGLLGLCPRCRVQWMAEHPNEYTLEKEKIVDGHRWIRSIYGELSKFGTPADAVKQPYTWTPKYNKKSQTLSPYHKSLRDRRYYHEEDFDLLRIHSGITIPDEDKVMEHAQTSNRQVMHNVSVAKFNERNEKIVEEWLKDARRWDEENKKRENEESERNKIIAEHHRRYGIGQWH